MCPQRTIVHWSRGVGGQANLTFQINFGAILELRKPT